MSIFYVVKRSVQELVLEIELEDKSKTTITSEPIDKTDAIVLTA